MELQITFSDDGEYGAEEGELCNRGKGLIIVNFFDLAESLSYNSCLIFLNLAIRSSFDKEDPLAPYHLLVVETRDNFINCHAFKSLSLVLAGQFPFCCVRACHCFCKSAWISGHICMCNTGVLGFGLLFIVVSRWASVVFWA